MIAYVAMWLPDSGDKYGDDPDVLGVHLSEDGAKEACQEQQNGYLSRNEEGSPVLAWESIPLKRSGSSWYDTLSPGWVADAGVGGNYFVLSREVGR